MGLKNKVAVVTGGSQGIGEGISVRLAQAGAVVVILNRTEAAGKRVAAKINADGGSAKSIAVDVTDYAATKAAVDAIVSDCGTVDILVNNVGTDKMQPFVDTDEALWDRLIAINYKSFLICSRLCAPLMIAQKSGKIITISSDSARLGQMNEVLYAGVKGALVASSKSLARELARYNINVNCVSPGPTETPLIDEIRKTEKGAQIVDGTAKRIPFRRLGDPTEVGDLVVFFASEESKYITGQVLSISGGLTMIG